MTWFKNEKDLDAAIGAFESSNGILGWTDGRDQVAAFVKPMAGMEQKGVISRAHVYMSKLTDGTAFIVLSAEQLTSETVAEYADIVASPVGRPKLRKRQPQAKPKQKMRPVVKTGAVPPETVPTPGSAEEAQAPAPAPAYAGPYDGVTSST